MGVMPLTNNDRGSSVVCGIQRWMRLSLLLAIMAGCSGRLSQAECQMLDQQITDALAMPGGSCQTDADCELVGGPLDFPTCDCAPYVVNCEGVAIPNNAPGLARAKQLIDQSTHGGCSHEACDCGPLVSLHCTPDHRCTGTEPSCLPQPPPDAGIDAPADGP